MKFCEKQRGDLRIGGVGGGQGGGRGHENGLFNSQAVMMFVMK